MKLFANSSIFCRCIRFVAVLACGFAVGNLRAELYVSVSDVVDVGSEVEFSYLSSHAEIPDGPLHKVVLLVDGEVADASGYETGVLKNVFDRPGVVPFLVKAYGADGQVLDEWVGSVSVRGIGMSHPEDGLSVPLGSPLILTADATFGGRLVSRVVFEADPSSAGAYTAIAGSDDASPPYSCIHVPAQTGIYSFRARAFHGDGTESVSSPVVVQVLPRLDGQAPVVSVSDPVSGSTVAAGIEIMVSVDVQVPGGSPIREVGLYVDGLRVFQSDGASESGVHRFAWQPLQPGEYHLRAMATDVAGRRSVSHEVRVEVVSGGCFARMILPVDRSVYEAGKVVPLSAVAGGAGGSVGRVGLVEFVVDGFKVAEVGEAPFQAGWTPVRPGNYQVAARVVDVDGLSSGMSDYVTVRIVEGSPPVVKMMEPQADEYFRPGDSVFLKAGGFDSNGILSMVAFYANDVWIGNGTLENGAFVLDYELPSAGVYSFRAVASNDSGNQAYSEPVRVNVEERAGLRPLVRVISPLPDDRYSVGNPLQLGVDARDPDGTIREVQFSSEGVLIGKVTGYPYVLPAFVLDKPGAHRFRVVAIDNDGNRSMPVEIDVFVHSQTVARPSVGIVWPSADQVFEVGQTLWVDAVASDSDGTVTEVRFSLNGHPLGASATTFPYQSTFVRLDNPGTYTIEAVAFDDQGLMSTVAVRSVLVVASTETPSPVFDPLTNNRDFVFGIYMDCLGRTPDDREVETAVQTLDFGAQTRASWVVGLVESPEGRTIRAAYACWHALMGRWPSPQEFRYFLTGVDWKPESLGVSPVDDHGDSEVDATIIESPEGSLSGSIQSRADKDVFVFRVDSRETLTFQTLGSTDTAGVLKDSDGRMIAYDDDSGGFFNCFIQRLLDPGVYFFEISGYLGNTGPYTLMMQAGYSDPVGEDLLVPSVSEAIDRLLISDSYLSAQGSIGDMGQESDRREWFRQLFRHRFSQNPSLQQEVQAASRLAAASSPGGFVWGFINNSRVGMHDYLYGMPDVSGRDLAAFLLGSILKNAPVESGVHSLSGLSPLEMVERILQNPEWKERYLPGRAEVRTEAVDSALTDELQLTALQVATDAPVSGSGVESRSVDPSNPFAGIQEASNGWKYSPWFGYVNDGQYPWIYHEQIGWMWMRWTAPANVNLWTSEWDWIYTRPEFFPQVYRYRDDCWIYLDLNKQPGGYGVFNHATGVWER